MFIRKSGESKKRGGTIASSCSHGTAVGVMNIFLMRGRFCRAGDEPAETRERS
ncbi:hypothetical protein BAMY6639_14165 [Bacillus amyloliquefaciens UMAF6639]|nr:hypothetical protein BAMY6639_14165 [Bacillus amyloliquefaciens UMAF6639]RAP05331.1 hypothetical protein HS9_01862 [Bacillus velezensis]